MVIRVILLEKKGSLENGCFKDLPIPSCLGPWLSFGHFDSIYTYTLDQGNMFHLIGKNNLDVSKQNTSSAYYHPLYLICNDSTRDASFWGKKQGFLSVSRIHFSQKIDVAKLRKGLEKELRQWSIDCNIYQTIELSNLVVVASSNRLRDLLKFALSLRKNPAIGKVYTYLGICYSKIVENFTPELSDTISFLSMRFSISQACSATRILDDIRGTVDIGTSTGKTYSITGLNDVVITWTDLPSRSVVNLYRHWFVPDDNEKVEPPKSIFSEITTRAGLEDTFLPPESSEKFNSQFEYKKKLLKICNKLVSDDILFQTKIQSRLNLEKLRCGKTLSELTKSLYRLAKTAVMDTFVFLMLPAVYSFYENILLLSNCELEKNIHSYYEFVECWNHLMEHIMRTEGQLTHYSEFRPMLYDMPLVMIEYTLAFLRQCSSVLQADDKDAAEIHFLLVPRLSKRINTTELFAADEKHSGLIYVLIPLHLLYDPKAILSQLCHEVSHFVGEKPRNRETRLKCFSESVAGLAGQHIFISFDDALIKTIQKEILEVLQSKSAKHMSKMKDAVDFWAKNLLNSDNEGSSQFAHFVRDVVLSGNGRKVSFSTDKNLQRYAYNNFKKLLNTLCMLYREVFADICMLRLLNIDRDYYLDSLIERMYIADLSDIVDVNEDDDLFWEFYAIRYYICMKACGNSVERGHHKQHQKWDRFFIEIEKIGMALNNPKTNVKSFYPRETIQPLLNYANECYTTISNILTNSKLAKNISDLFSNVVNDRVNYSELEKTINDYRREMLRSLSPDPDE